MVADGRLSDCIDEKRVRCWNKLWPDGRRVLGIVVVAEVLLDRKASTTALHDSSILFFILPNSTVSLS